jgi:hypothetical protein
MDDDNYERLSRIHVDLIELCQWLNEKRDIEIASRLIPIAAQKKRKRALFLPRDVAASTSSDLL